MNDYSHNTAIEDYLTNILNSLPKNAVYFTYGDTVGFGTYYLKDVKKIRPDIVQIQNSWGAKWAPKKFKKKFPDLVSEEDNNFYNSFNFENYRFFTNFNSRMVHDGYTVSYSGLVFEISKFKSIHNYNRFNCHKNISLRNDIKLNSFSSFEYGRIYTLGYGNCFYAKAKDFLKKKDIEAAKKNLILGLEIAPNHPYLQRDLCRIYKMVSDPKQEQCTTRYFEMLSIFNEKYFEFLE